MVAMPWGAGFWVFSSPFAIKQGKTPDPVVRSVSPSTWASSCPPLVLALTPLCFLKDNRPAPRPLNSEELDCFICRHCLRARIVLLPLDRLLESSCVLPQLVAKPAYLGFV